MTEPAGSGSIPVRSGSVKKIWKFFLSGSGSGSVHDSEFLEPNRNRILTGSSFGSGSKTEIPIPIPVFWPRFRSEPDRGQV